MLSLFSPSSLLDASGFVPRAVCGSWTEGEVLLNNVADLAVALAYLVIPFILTRLQRRRRDLPFSWILVVFGLFIITCGATHIMEIVLFYHPIYRMAGFVKVLTALASWAAVFALIKILPALVALRSPDELEALNRELELEIAQRRETEEQKEVLLRELHHRVKNNLQMVSSLLQLQESKNSEGGDILKECRGRVRALAMVHESLYLSPDLSKVDMEHYLRRMCLELGQSAKPPCEVTIETNVRLHTDTAVPCGLIVNELVTNAIKHGRSGGEIKVCLLHEGGRLGLRVSDDGPGFPDQFKPDDLDSLGLRLVTALTGQLGGEIEYANDSGGKVTLTFPSDGG